MIRKAEQKDKEAIWRIHTAAIREICKSCYSEEEVAAWASLLKPESYEEAIRSREFFVAETGGGTVGFGQLNTETGEVEAVYVSPQVVGRSVGRELLQKLEAVAREKGLESLHLTSSLNAVGFYERAGYEAKHEARHELPNGVSLACVYMEKGLASKPRAA